MNTITIAIERAAVLEEVAKATDYVGAKSLPTEAEPDPRERILATDQNLDDLARLWNESVAGAEESFKELIVNSTPTNQGHTFELEVSSGFDVALKEGVQKALMSYFVASILGGWFKFANKAEADDYFAQAAQFILGAERLLYSRRRPTLRITRNP